MASVCWSGRVFTADERERVLLRVRVRDQRDPARHVGVVAARDDRRHVVLASMAAARDRRREAPREQSMNDRRGSLGCTARGREAGAFRLLYDCAIRNPALAGFRICAKTGGVLLSRGLAPRVPSALAGLTSLFGMGRGVSPPL